ncbi:MAG: hypothetical protein HYU41_20405 [Candidatus Rokubacteria bacterium]|nr:hypothetical protein [Candidatus Rokubacteria bacterium]
MLSLSIALAREWLASGQMTRMHIVGGSMRPFLPRGSSIVVSAVDAARLGIGDLVVYEHEDQLVCHRIIARRRSDPGLRFLTRGDWWRAAAAWVPAAAVVGIVGAVERRGRVTRLDTWPRRLGAVGRASASQVIGCAVGFGRHVRSFRARRSSCAPA